MLGGRGGTRGSLYVSILGGLVYVFPTTSKSGLNPTTKRNWTPPNQNQPGVLLNPGLTVFWLNSEKPKLS